MRTHSDISSYVFRGAMASLARTTNLASRPRNVGKSSKPTVKPNEDLIETFIESNSSGDVDSGLADGFTKQVLTSVTAPTKV